MYNDTDVQYGSFVSINKISISYILTQYNLCVQ